MARLRNTRDTSAEFFGKSERWLWQHSQPRGPIPCVRIGTSVFYDWDHLDQEFTVQQNAAERECHRTPDKRQVNVDDILRLHQDGFSIADIARKLILLESTVQHVIEHGESPESQPQWPTPE